MKTTLKKLIACISLILFAAGIMAQAPVYDPIISTPGYSPAAPPAGDPCNSCNIQFKQCLNNTTTSPGDKTISLKDIYNQVVDTKTYNGPSTPEIDTCIKNYISCATTYGCP